MARQPRGGKGSNQYATRGTSTAIAAVPADVRRAVQDQIDSESAAAAFGSDPVPVAAARGRDAQIRAAATATAKEREKLADRKSCPPELLDVLADDPSPDVRVKVANNPATPAATIARIAETDTEQQCWAAALRNPNCPAETLTAAVTDAGKRWTVAAHPNTPPGILRDLIHTADRPLRAKVLDNPSCPPDVLADHATTGAYSGVIAWNPNTPPEILREWATGPDPGLNAQVLMNPSCPPDVLADVVESYKFGDVRGWQKAVNAATNPSLPEATFERILTKNQEDGQPSPMRPHVANNLAVPDRLLFTAAPIALHQDPNSQVTSRALQRKDCPPETLDDIFHAWSDIRLHRRVAAHRNCPPGLLEECAEQHDDATRRAVAMNPNCPPEVRRKLAGDPNISVSSAASRGRSR